MNRKVISVIAALAMLLSSFSTSFAATDSTAVATGQGTYKDVNGHWASEAIYKWSGYGVIGGHGGYFRPNDTITRGEMACILNNMMDYQTASKNTFADLKDGKFYTDAVLKANAAGIMTGDKAKLLHPTDKITRQEAAVMMAKAFAVDGGTIADTKFKDAEAVSTWARASVFGLEAKGYISGSSGKYNPKSNITRAETVTIINKIVKGYYIEAGTYTDNVDGTAIIKVPNVILDGITVLENLIIAEGVGTGDATLNSVTVKGNTVVRGGGENSIHITGTSSITNIKIETIGGKLRVEISEGNTVKVIEIAEGEEIIITGTVGTVEIDASNATVYATEANISSALIRGSNSTIIVNKESKIGSVSVLDTAENTIIKAEKGAVVSTITAAAQTTISGEGAIEKVILNPGANNSRVSTPNTQTTVGLGVTGVTGGGGIAIPAGSSITNNSTGNGVVVATPTSSGGGSGNNNPTPTVAVTGISVAATAGAITVVNGDTLQMSAVVTPVNATDKTVTWSVATLVGGTATISQAGLLTATGCGTVRVSATNTASGVVGIKDITVVAPINNYTALGDSITYGMSATPGNGYTNLFYNNLKAINGNEAMKLVNLGIPGEKSSDLLNKLQHDTTTIDAVSKAKVITISVGGNNLLSPVIGALATAYGLNPTSATFATDLATELAKPENQQKLISVISGLQPALAAGVQQFSTDWIGILGTIKVLNPQAQVYATTLYNPFNQADPLHSVFDIAIKGINAIINTPNTGCMVADVYTSFRNYQGTTPLLTFSVLTGKLDPHPTTKGHEVIYQAHLDAKAVTITDIRVTSATTVTFKSNAVPTTVTWNGTDVKASMTGTNPYTITVPKITKTENTLIVNAAGYTAKTVAVTVTETIGNLKLIKNASELADAIVNQEDGQSWIIKAGTYDLIQTELDKYKANRYNANGLVTAGTGGETAWYFPITADNLMITGEGTPVITSSVYSANGNWSTQNFITVWGDDVTIEGINIDCKTETNKAIEVLGINFKLKNVKTIAKTFDDGKIFGGSVYFSSANVGDALLENVELQAWISAPSSVTGGTIKLKKVMVDFRNNEYADYTWNGTRYQYGVISKNSVFVNELGGGLTAKVDNTAYDLKTNILNKVPSGTKIELAAGTYYLLTEWLVGDFIIDSETNGAVINVLPVGTKVIRNSSDLEAAIKNQTNGQTWLIASGNYPLNPHNDISAGSFDAQTGWYFPITVDNLTIIGERNPVLYGATKTTNGAWASQNLITVFGNNVTFKGLTIMPKVETNKSVEVVGDVKFTIEDCIFTPNTITSGAGATDGGSLYFNGQGKTGTKAILVKNNTFNYTSVAFDGVAGSNITISNNTWDNIGGYAIGNTYWGSTARKRTQYADVNVTGNNFNNVTDSTKIIAARLNQIFKLDAANKINSTTINKNEFGKYINFNNLTYWIECKFNKVIVDGVIYESPYKDVDAYATNSSQLTTAISAAEEGDVILIAAGDYTITETIEVNKEVTIRGAAGFATTISTYGGNPVFKLSAAATLDRIFINKTDKATQTLVELTANGATIKDSKFMGQYVQGDPESARGFVPNAGIKDLTIESNTFINLRQPAYLNRGTGTIRNNYVENTRGWVLCGDASYVLTGNTFKSNAVDIAVISSGNGDTTNNYTDVAAISTANNGAFVENQLSGISAVNGKAGIGSVQALLNAINSAEENATLELAPITFNITQTLHTSKPLTIKGAGVGKTILNVTGVPDKAWGVLINKSNTTLCDMTIVSDKTANYNNNLKVSDNGNTPNSHMDGIVIKNVSIQGGKGLDINNADAIVDLVAVVNSKGVSIAVSNNSKVTITNTTTTNGAWGSLGVMEGGEKSEVTIGEGNVFEEGSLYSENYSEKGNQITGLSSEWISFVNERNQFVYVKQLPQGAYITTAGVTKGYLALQAAVAAAQEGDVIMLVAGTYELPSQLIITKPMTIKGIGTVIITPAAGFVGDSNNANLISIKRVIGLVTLENLTINNSKRSGINVWESTDVKLKDIISMNNAGTGLVVNNSVVVADNLNTSGNGWGYGVNVDNGSNPSPGAPATSFTLNSGTIADTKQIVTDKGGVTIVAPGYSVFDASKVL